MTTLVISAAAMWVVVGLIWTIQLVRYPVLASYSSMAPRTAAIEHQRRISRVVAEGSDDRAAERLFTTNWLRAIAWTSRGLALAWVMAT